MEEDVPEERAPFRTDEGLCASRPRACRPDCLLEAAASLSSPSDMDVIHNMAIAESDASESRTRPSVISPFGRTRLEAYSLMSLVAEDWLRGRKIVKDVLQRRKRTVC